MTPTTQPAEHTKPIETQFDKLTESAVACNEAIREMQVTTNSDANCAKLAEIQFHIASVLMLAKELSLE